VLRLDPSLPGAQQLVYSTLIGGAASDGASSLAVDAAGFATIGGSTSSSNWLTTAGAWNGSPGGNGDGMVARLDLLPTGVAAYGTSTPGCSGPLRAGVCSWPQVGNASFQGTCAGAPANGTGLLAIGTAGRTAPVTIAGAQFWIDLQGPTATVFETSNALGLAHVPLPLPANPALAGLRVFLQFLWLDGCATGGVSASNALAITVQP